MVQLVDVLDALGADTYATEVVELDAELVAALEACHAGPLVLPDRGVGGAGGLSGWSGAGPGRAPSRPSPAASEDSDDGDGGGGGAGALEAFLRLWRQRAEKNVSRAVRAVGGAAFVKAGARAAVDAEWVRGALRCDDAGDVAALLLASRRVAEAVEAAAAGGRGLPLLLRRFDAALAPASEWRVFVRDGRVLAVSQRNLGVFNPHLARDAGAVRDAICRAVARRLQPALRADALVLDVAVGEGLAVTVVDVCAFAEGACDPLLFDWAELRGEALRAAANPPVRVIEGHDTIGKGPKDSMGLPLEALAGMVDVRSAEALQKGFEAMR